MPNSGPQVKYFFLTALILKTDFVVVVVFLFYTVTSKVMSGQSVNLTTLFLGRLRPPKYFGQYSTNY